MEPLCKDAAGTALRAYAPHKSLLLRECFPQMSAAWSLVYAASLGARSAAATELNATISIPIIGSYLCSLRVDGRIRK